MNDDHQGSRRSRLLLFAEWSAVQHDNVPTWPEFQATVRDERVARALSRGVPVEVVATVTDVPVEYVRGVAEAE